MKNNPPAGFTIIELMVTLAVAAVILTVGIPSFKQTLDQNRLAVQVNDFITSLNYARSEAVTRSMQITVCKSANSSAVLPACTAAGSWDQGWITFTDSTAAGTIGVVDAGENILRIHAALEGNIGLTQDANFSNWIGYLPSGASSGNGGVAQGSFTLCHPPYARVLTINATGRINLSKAGC